MALTQSKTVLLLIVGALSAASAACESENTQTTLLEVFLDQVLNHFNASAMAHISA